jgi:hypothetical protein
MRRRRDQGEGRRHRRVREEEAATVRNFSSLLVSSK